MSLTAQPIRILLVDPQTLCRVAIRMLIESWGQIKVVGDTGHITEALALAEREKPEVILTELDFRSGSSQDLLPKLLSVAKARVLILTHVQDVEIHRTAICNGARGLVLKEHLPEQLHSAILTVNAGEVWLDSRLTTSIVTQMARANRPSKDDKESTGLTQLSRRENEVAQLVGEGLSNKEIAARTFISETTVRHHLTSVYKKLDLTNRLELVIFLLHPKTKKPLPRSTSQNVLRKDSPDETRSDRSSENSSRALVSQHSHGVSRKSVI